MFHVTVGGEKGLFNTYGSTILPCRYDEITSLKNRYIVKKNNTYSVFNNYGSTILACRFEKIELLSNGNYMATLNGEKSLYNTYGSFISNYSNNNVVYSTEKAVE